MGEQKIPIVLETLGTTSKGLEKRVSKFEISHVYILA